MGIKKKVLIQIAESVFNPASTSTVPRKKKRGPGYSVLLCPPLSCRGNQSSLVSYPAIAHYAFIGACFVLHLTSVDWFVAVKFRNIDISDSTTAESF